jgi:hypothetical protein
MLLNVPFLAVFVDTGHIAADSLARPEGLADVHEGLAVVCTSKVSNTIDWFAKRPAGCGDVRSDMPEH